MIKVTYERYSTHQVDTLSLLLFDIVCLAFCVIIYASSAFFYNLYMSIDRNSIQISSGFLSYLNGTRKVDWMKCCLALIGKQMGLIGVTYERGRGRNLCRLETMNSIMNNDGAEYWGWERESFQRLYWNFIVD